ncbi:MAG: ORF6N domain-containing protein, partial [Fibromonadaceae bacterium]|nr:ORF6N domain-containing protein [Fibromonadaceae bacterium]
MKDIIQSNQVENLIIVIRGERVLLDSDVAKLYGVETREINQAVKNNPDKFPKGYILSLNNEEKNEVIKIFDNLQKLKFSPTNIKAFTEKGLYMLATILKSPKAT